MFSLISNKEDSIVLQQDLDKFNKVSILTTVVCDNANRLFSQRPIIHHITSYLYVLSLLMIIPHPNPIFQLGVPIACQLHEHVNKLSQK